MGILGAERCFRPEEGATLRLGMPWGLSPRFFCVFFFPLPSAQGRSFLERSAAVDEEVAVYK